LYALIVIAPDECIRPVAGAASRRTPALSDADFILKILIFIYLFSVAHDVLSLGETNGQR
jgi:hypothetical protein